jgi:exonuclease III
MSSRQKINRETSELLNTLEQMDIVNIYRIFQSTSRQYTFFLETYGTFSKVDHILVHKTSVNKFRKIKITSCMISDHNRIKLDLNNKRNHRKYSKPWRLNNTLPND